MKSLQSKIDTFYKLATMTREEAWAHLRAGKPLKHTYIHDTHTVHISITWFENKQLGMILFHSNKHIPREIGITREQIDRFINREYV